MAEAEHDQKHKQNDSSIYYLRGYKYTIVDRRALLGEFLATCLLCFIGCGVAVSTQALVVLNPDTTLDNTFLLGVSIAFGFAVTVLVYTIAPFSGGHLNPAVSLSFYLLKDMDFTEFLQYIFAQSTGAMLGTAMVWGIFSSKVLKQATEGNPPFFVGSNFVHSDVSVGSAFLGEMMGTFILVWTILMTAINTKSIAGNLAPIAVGWSVVLAHLILIPLTGCGINPARSFGSHIISIIGGGRVGMRGWWIFYTAPFCGATLATKTSSYLFCVEKREKEVPLPLIETSTDISEQKVFKSGSDETGLDKLIHSNCSV